MYEIKIAWFGKSPYQYELTHPYASFKNSDRYKLFKKEDMDYFDDFHLGLHFRMEIIYAIVKRINKNVSEFFVLWQKYKDFHPDWKRKEKYAKVINDGFRFDLLSDINSFLSEIKSFMDCMAYFNYVLLFAKPEEFRRMENAKNKQYKSFESQKKWLSKNIDQHKDIKEYIQNLEKNYAWFKSLRDVRTFITTHYHTPCLKLFDDGETIKIYIQATSTSIRDEKKALFPFLTEILEGYKNYLTFYKQFIIKIFKEGV